MESIEVVRDVNPDAVKCVVCGSVAGDYMDFAFTTPICQNMVCQETIFTGINKMLVAIKNEQLEVPA